MTPFQKAYMPFDEMQRNIEDHMKAWRSGNTEARQMTPALDEESARAFITKVYHDLRENETVWRNDTYQVSIRDVEPAGFPAMKHLSIKRIDRQPIHDWRELQEIKNQLVSPEHEAVELYPSEKRKVDTANQYHLWVLADKGQWFPFGFEDRLVMNSTFGKAVNRPLEEVKPEDRHWEEELSLQVTT